MKRVEFGYSFSSYLHTLYSHSKINKTPFFKINSDQITIIKDPLDYYTTIIKSIKSATFRIAISSLYLGTGTMERYILYSLKKKLKESPNLKLSMIYDWNRSQRVQDGESSVEMLKHFYKSVNMEQVTIGFYQNSRLKGFLGEVIGVHHQKIIVFDDEVLIGGANLSKNYFLNRKDRYMQFKNCSRLSDYFYDYLQVLVESSHKLQQHSQSITNQNIQVMKAHYKIWKYGHAPHYFADTIYLQNQAMEQEIKNRNEQQKRTLDDFKVFKSNNMILSEKLGKQIQMKEQMSREEHEIRKQKMREKLFSTLQEEEVGNILHEIELGKSEESIVEKGKEVYIFPVITNEKLNENSEMTLLQNILKNAINNLDIIKISTGYMNLPSSLIDLLKKSKAPVHILCSSPEANSFYKGGFIKTYIPHFYRAFEASILSQSTQIFIYQFIKSQWSFHSKGIWLQETENSYLTVLGSSNYNARSANRDNQIQFYLYSTCPYFNQQLDKQWVNQLELCQPINLQKITNDKDTYYNFAINLVSKLLSSYL